MWAAYFLPKWMTSHDLASGKSAERYKSAMRVVGETGSISITNENDSFKKINQIANAVVGIKSTEVAKTPTAQSAPITTSANVSNPKTILRFAI